MLVRACMRQCPASEFAVGIGDAKFFQSFCELFLSEYGLKDAERKSEVTNKEKMKIETRFWLNPKA